mmetsp:Transcript_20270/g.39615  ORF Transcript_20270/g.39615 Transcript_20270/m.39615 type:complete len:213 (+) Transcript_20270:266-904(+)
MRRAAGQSSDSRPKEAFTSSASNCNRRRIITEFNRMQTPATFPMRSAKNASLESSRFCSRIFVRLEICFIFPASRTETLLRCFSFGICSAFFCSQTCCMASMPTCGDKSHLFSNKPGICSALPCSEAGCMESTLVPEDKSGLFSSDTVLLANTSGTEALSLVSCVFDCSCCGCGVGSGVSRGVGCGVVRGDCCCCCVAISICLMLCCITRWC